MPHYIAGNWTLTPVEEQFSSLCCPALAPQVISTTASERKEDYHQIRPMMENEIFMWFPSMPFRVSKNRDTEARLSRTSERIDREEVKLMMNDESVPSKHTSGKMKENMSLRSHPCSIFRLSLSFGYVWLVRKEDEHTLAMHVFHICMGTGRRQTHRRRLWPESIYSSLPLPLRPYVGRLIIYPPNMKWGMKKKNYCLWH